METLRTQRTLVVVVGCLLLVATLSLSVVLVVKSSREAPSDIVRDSDLQLCGTLQTGDVCWFPILGFHPTQFSIGFEEVRCKIYEVNAFTDPELSHYLNKKRVPVILGPDRVPYMLDRHHTSTVILATRRSSEMIVEVKEDWSSLSESEFWQQMIDNSYCYMYNPEQTFKQPPQYIPPHVSGLLDDPYRSLAYFARKCGAFGDPGVPYVEYYWAEYYRKHIQPNVDIPDTSYCEVYGYDDELCWPRAKQHEWVYASLPAALDLSIDNEEASDLPGYGEGQVEGIPCGLDPDFEGWTCPAASASLPQKTKKKKK